MSRKSEGWVSGGLFRHWVLLTTFLVAIFIALTWGSVLVMGMPKVLNILHSPEMRYSVRLSVFTATVSTALCLSAAIPVGYALERYDMVGKKLVGFILEIPLVLPPIVSGICLLILFGSSALGSLLSRIGIDFVFTVPGIILAQFYVNLPSTITIIRSAMRSVDRRIEFVGRTLGCSERQAFLRLTLPLARNGILAATIICWSKALGEFGAVLMLAGATRFKTETLPLFLYLSMSTGDMEAVMASAAVLILISVVSLIIFGRLEVDGHGRSIDI